MNLYLVDLFNDRILENQTVRPGQSIDVTGRYGVQVPDGIDVGVPSNISALIQSKYEGISSFYGFFTDVAYDDMRTASKIDTGNSSRISVSPRVGMCLQPPPTGSSILISTTQTLLSPPTQILFTYDSFFYEDVDVKAGRFQRSYVLPSANDAEASVVTDVSFDGGSTYTTVVAGQVVSIPLANQGTDLIVRFTRTSGTKRLFVGSWAVLYA